MPITDEECPHCEAPVHTDGLIDGVHHLGCGEELPEEMVWAAESRSDSPTCESYE